MTRKIVNVQILPDDEKYRKVQWWVKKRELELKKEEEVFKSKLEEIREQYKLVEIEIENPVCKCGHYLILYKTQYGPAMFCPKYNNKGIDYHDHNRIWNWAGYSVQNCREWAKKIRENLGFDKRGSRNFISPKHFVKLCEAHGMEDLRQKYINESTKDKYNGLVKARKSATKHEEFLVDILQRIGFNVLHEPHVRAYYDDGSEKLMIPDIICISPDNKNVLIFELKTEHWYVSFAKEKGQLSNYVEAVKFACNLKNSGADVIGAYICPSLTDAKNGIGTIHELLSMSNHDQVINYAKHFSINSTL